MFFSAKKPTPEEGKSNLKKSQAAPDKEREMLILSKKLEFLEKSVLPPSTVEEKSQNLAVQHVADDSSDDEHWTAEEVEEIMPKSKSDSTTRVLQHPPQKCMSVLCKEEKEIKYKEISHLREEIIQLKEELRKYKKEIFKNTCKLSCECKNLVLSTELIM